MARKKNYRPLIALAALAVAALALATMTFTNVTYWLINATLPPAMKYPGSDTQIAGRLDDSGYNNYVYVSYYYDSNGYNITKISIVGFTGDPTDYTDVIRLCNKAYDGTLYVYLHYVGTVTGTYESYVKEFWVYPAGYRGGVGFTSGSTVTDAGPYSLGRGECLSLGVHVFIDPALKSDHPEALDGKTVIATYQVNVEFRTSP